MNLRRGKECEGECGRLAPQTQPRLFPQKSSRLFADKATHTPTRMEIADRYCVILPGNSNWASLESMLLGMCGVIRIFNDDLWRCLETIIVVINVVMLLMLMT